MTGQPSRARRWAKAVGLVFAAFIATAILAASIRGGAWIAAVAASTLFGLLLFRPDRSVVGFSPPRSRQVAGIIAAMTILLALTPTRLPTAPVHTTTAPLVQAEDKPVPRQEEENAASSPREPMAPGEALKLVSFDWHKDGFGTVMLLDAAIRNAGRVPMKDIEVRCTTYGASGTELGHHAQTIYDIVKPGQTRRFRRVNLGFLNQQAERADCSIVDSSPATS